MSFFLYMASLLPMFITGFSAGAPAWCAQPPVQAVVSIAPQKYFVEKIGGAHVTVTVMVPPGAEPHAYEPKPRQVMALSKAQVYFAIGAPFENAWSPRFKSVNPRLYIVHTDANIHKIPLSAEEHHEQPQAKYSVNEMDLHIWLSPPLVKIQARAVMDGLKKIDPSRSKEYQANFNGFAAELDSLDSYLKSLFSGVRGKKDFIVFHPAWSYFAQAYGLNEIPVEIAGKEPKPSEIMNLIKLAREKGITVIFVQPQFSSRTAKILADAIHAKIVNADPMAENWAENIRSVAEEFKEAIR
jgi:zinc transport system substrate-binding protein